VEEIQISTLGASAEYPAAQGGVFSVVFRSGTNTLKGDGSAFSFPPALTSSPIKVACNCPAGTTGFTDLMSRFYSGHIGGPISKDRVWFFGGGVYAARIDVPPGTDPSLIRTTWYSDRIVGKVTWQISNRWRFQQVYQLGPYGGQATPTLKMPYSTLTASYGDTQLYASEVNGTVSSNTLITVRVTGYNTLVYPSKPLTGDYVTPERVDEVSGVASGGAPSFNNPSTQLQGQAAKISHYIQGSRIEHNLRAGLQFNESSAASFSAYPSGVQYMDLNGAPDQASLRDAFVSGAAYTSQGVWGEDQLTLAGRVTLSLGLRFDRMHATSPDEPAVDNQLHPTGATIKGLGSMFTWNVWSPRVGFNVKLTGDAKTIVRGDFGRAHRPIFLSNISQVYPGLSPITLARWSPATQSYSTIVSVTNPISNLAIDPDVRSPYTDQYAIGVDRELRRNLAVAVTYVHKQGLDQLGWTDIGGVYGRQTVTLGNGQLLTLYPLLNAASARKFLYTNGPGFNNRYDGLLLTINKRLSGRWQANVSYTYSKAQGLLGGNTGSGTSGQDPNAYINAGGLLALDRPQMFTMSSAYQIPKVELQAAVSVMALSGTPYAPQALVRLPQGNTTINIAPTDGTYRLSSDHLVYLRLNKVLFHRGNRELEVGAEVQNLLQDEAVTSVVSQNLFGATFGRPASWVEPRRAQLQARVRF
jgi:hypothetical protein